MEVIAVNVGYFVPPDLAWMLGGIMVSKSLSGQVALLMALAVAAVKENEKARRNRAH